MDLDDIYVQIGEFGPQQRLYFFSLALFNLYPPFNMLQTVFTGESPSFTCVPNYPNGTTLHNSCPNNKISECLSINFTYLPDTFTKEWKLVCDNSYKGNLIQSIFMGGVMSGALIFGPVADTFGRKTTLLITLIGTLASGIISSFMPTFLLYVALRYVTGFFNAGIMISAFVLSSEIVGPSKRSICGNIIQAFFASGIILYSALGYYIRTWRLLSLASSSFGALLLITFFWIPESPRWLLTHSRSDEGIRILRKIAASNKSVLPQEEMSLVRAHTSSSHLSLKHVFLNPKISAITLIQLFSWFVNSVVYYGLTLAAGELGSNIYASEALSGAVEIPAYIAATFLLDWIGRRKTLAGFMLIGGISCLVVRFTPYIIFPLLGKLAIAASFSIIYIHSAELFPTVLRNSGLGLCSCAARIGGILSPLISLADRITYEGSFLLLGFLSCSSGLLNLFLPETLNKPMPETLEDLESLINGYAQISNVVEEEPESDSENENENAPGC